MQQRIRVVNPETVAKPVRGYYSNSLRVSAGPLLFISGQLGIDRDGRFVGPGAAAQMEQIFSNLQSILEASGATLASIVQCTLYLTDITDVSVIAPVRLKYFPKDGPASALVQVSALAYPEAKIEMDAIAAIDT